MEFGLKTSYLESLMMMMRRRKSKKSELSVTQQDLGLKMTADEEVFD